MSQKMKDTYYQAQDKSTNKMQVKTKRDAIYKHMMQIYWTTKTTQFILQLQEVDEKEMNDMLP